MGLTLNGRTALVTGASSGIGAATAIELATAGCRVRLVGRDAARLNEVAALTGGAAVPADMRTRAGLDAVATAAEDVDILVNNAGVGWAGRFDQMSSEDIAHLIEVNLTASLELTHAAWPHMARRRRGALVFVSSIAAVGVREEAVYAATKAASRSFADSIRYEAERNRISVLTVLPAGVRTPFFARQGRRYQRRFPAEVSAQRVAQALVAGIQRGRPEVFVPRWTQLAARLHGAAPSTFHQLAKRFG